MFSDHTFSWVQNELGKHDLEDLRKLRHAVAHRYSREKK